nr:biotin transporter BioY [uncultured Sphaerochaeta sp.]
MSNAPLASLHRLVWTALLAALVAVGSFIHFPLGPVPVSLQTFFVLVAGFILGGSGGAICVGLYILAGLAGLPVFSGGKSGLAHLLGPTGGFFIGFFLITILSGQATGKGTKMLSWPRGLMWGGIGFLALYVAGVSWLKWTLGLDWLKALTVGFLPFIPGDVIKLVAAVGAYRFLFTKRLLPS